MPRHLCIVARESSPLYGYLTIAFRERPPGAPTLDIVLDRRQANVPIAGVTDRRQHSAIDEALRTRGYAIFTGPGGGAPSRNDEAFIERAIGLLADVERRGPLALRFKTRRSSLIAGLARGTITVLALALVVATVLRAGGVGRIATAAAEIAGSTVTRLEDAWLSFRGGTVPREARQADAPARLGPTPTPAPAPERSVGSPPSAAVAQAPTPAAPAAPARPFERTPPPAPEPRASVTLPPASRAPAADASRVPAGSAPTPSRDVAALESRALPAYTGSLPRVEMSRQASASGGGVVYVVRVTDSGGQPISGAQIFLRGRGADGQTRETQLDEADRPGVYRSGSLPPDLMPPSLNVGVYFSNMRVEIPLD